ncbi:YadA-like family protein [Gallibacterium anatis]|uniref:YadA-like family protein n=1 Tax=Gallibacterium anatis TaxID=750 RepID=UPI0039FD3D3A
MLGNNNRAIGYYGTAVGGANKIMGCNGVAIGARNTAGNFEGDRTFSNAVAIGWDNFVNGTSTGIGLKTVSTGNDAIAIGSQAVAGTERALDFFAKGIDYDQQPYYKQLQTQYPDLFGAYDDKEEGLNKVRQNIFNKYIGFFYTYGIKSLDDLTKASATSRDSILTALGWQYALTRDNVSAPVAIVKWSKALSDNSIALGAYSAITKADMDEVNSSLKDKAPFSGITLRQSGNLGSDGNTNGEYLTGAVSIGGPRYIQKEVDGQMQTVQEGYYVRQIKHLADATDDTDAVNLRQLKGLKEELGSASKSPAYKFAKGDNITIKETTGDDGVITVTISATDKDTTYTAGDNITIDKGNISATDTKYTAGDNITIDKDGKISAKDTTYTAGENITIDDNNKISAAKYEAGDNVSIKKKEGADNTFVISATNSGGGTDFNVKGDVGEATQVKSGDTVNITGGATGLSHNANIGVEKADDGLKLRLAKDITTESVTLSKGDNGKSTKMDAESVTVNNGKQSTKVSAESVSVNNGSQHTTVNAGGISVNSNNQAPVSLTSRGLDNGGNRISNVADGVQPHDAVNVSQLNRVKKKMEKHSDAGTAAAIAVGNLPHAMHSGKSMVAVAGGSYGGESAVAIGVSHTNEKGNVILKLSGTSDSNGKYGVGAGVGYEF